MPRSWKDKFHDAFRGTRRALVSERSFRVHLVMALAVALAAAGLKVSLPEACLLASCVTLVLALEIVNTAIESLARAVSREPNLDIAAALDMSSGAVLIASLGSAAIGTAILLNRLGLAVGWWS